MTSVSSKDFYIDFDSKILFWIFVIILLSILTK